MQQPLQSLQEPLLFHQQTGEFYWYFETLLKMEVGCLIATDSYSHADAASEVAAHVGCIDTVPPIDVWCALSLITIHSGFNPSMPPPLCQQWGRSWPSTCHPLAIQIWSVQATPLGLFLWQWISWAWLVYSNLGPRALESGWTHICSTSCDSPPVWMWEETWMLQPQ